ncbi:MAG: fatty acid desaturase [Hyphomicrobiales bacterium]|nr:fatty acid desaturase [Hyphomicrobiales bacterium]
MNGTKSTVAEEHKLLPAKELLKALAPYRQPKLRRSIFELFITIIPFIGFWVAAWLSLSISYWLTMVFSVIAGGFLVRFFLIQHDCGHGAFFRSKKINDWVGRILGVFTLTPYDIWRRSHAIHHSTSGNLDERGVGDIDTLTIREYRNLSVVRKVLYRLYRSPPVLFVIGPAFQFLLRNRLPQMFNSDKRDYWISAMGTNVSIAVVAAIFAYFMGLGAFLAVHLPITIVAASIGVWMFYVQHQFEDTFWECEDKWQMYEAALKGSSHYDLPAPFRWLTANIGIHHIHHLASRIPYYRLPDVLRDFPELIDIRRLTFRQSLSCINLRLWDEENKRLVSFAQARAIAT